jgi:hypothetical protein
MYFRRELDTFRHEPVCEDRQGWSPDLLVPRLAIDAGGRALLQAEEGPPQNLNGDVMQERRQLLRPVPGNGATYAGLRL